MKKLLSVTCLLVSLHTLSCLESVWRFECEKGYCQKKMITPDTESTALSLAACRLFCSEKAAIWPRPTGGVSVGNFLVKINVNSIDVLGANTADSGIADLVTAASNIFKKHVTDLVPQHRRSGGGKSLVVHVAVSDQETSTLTLTTDEGYNVTVVERADERVHATVEAATYFGARHGLETLSQLIVYDDLRGELQMAREVAVSDRPAYPYRGILLDTSRNFISIDAIKRTIEGMGASKLNRFHWHITDTHSFPYVAKSAPELAKYGAYSPTKVYTVEDVAGIVRFGLERGVAVLPEFDAPAHVGEGWQNTGLVICFNKQPWSHYCVEPPCGQFDPTQEKLYDVLEGIYGNMLDQFKPDIFHMGGDEVHFGCWNSTDSIVEWMAKEKGWGRSEHDFIKLWDRFQSEALVRLFKKAGKEMPVIMWTSTLTQKEYVEQYLPKEKYIIQIWTTGHDPQVRNLLNKGYKLILSNYEALYFDCGFAGWVTDGNNWCSPYIGWQKVYENKPKKIAGDKKGQILGSEATLWTEQVDSSAVDSRLWPRAAAMAEVLWSEPETSWRAAEQRFLVHRQRLINRGIAADALEPEWCMQYENNCPIGAKTDEF